ncbi:hypothetical protein AVEN_214227-1 [Araneus ventricosus]|uniref:Uncharacterized protein n=1 Tax=Araneus ventricosus TaxID=182803 RepID=A0A4Y2KWR0_ARAVE|nr:hypothetical protein AVEN_54986-1 [Araneus ventricosus]GBN05806.1 hypothetical protein AVEN_214227-1 [Araneus ventricosus]
MSWNTLSKFPHHTSGRTFEPRPDLVYTKPIYTMDLRWNRVSKMKPSGYEVKTLPSSHRGHLKKENSRGMNFGTTFDIKIADFLKIGTRFVDGKSVCISVLRKR